MRRTTWWGMLAANPRIRTCAKCATILEEDETECHACGRRVDDPAANVDRRIRLVLMLIFVGGAVALIVMSVINWMRAKP